MTLGSFDKKRHVFIGSFLAKKREACGLSQIQVANALGLKTAQSISNFERGMCGPPIGAIQKIIPLYGLTQKEVIGLLVEAYRDAVTEALSGRVAKTGKAGKVLKRPMRGRGPAKAKK